MVSESGASGIIRQDLEDNKHLVETRQKQSHNHQNTQNRRSYMHRHNEKTRETNIETYRPTCKDRQTDRQKLIWKDCRFESGLEQVKALHIFRLLKQ